jgi:hypothetical protein
MFGRVKLIERLQIPWRVEAYGDGYITNRFKMTCPLPAIRFNGFLVRGDILVKYGNHF